jgi:hypothetical protein
LIQIMQANDAAMLSESGKKQYEKTVLESPAFRALVDDIEGNAFDGRTSFRKSLKSDEEVRMFEVFVRVLKEAGYSSQIKYKTFGGILSASVKECVFYVSWESDDEQK